MTAIPPGYQLHTTTWENDGDNYQTKILSGLSKEDVEFYISILEQCGSKYNSRKFAKGFGNDEISAEELLSIVKQAVDEHPGISAEVKKKYEHNINVDSDDYDEDVAADAAAVIHDELCADALGATIDYEDYTNFIRVVEDIKVFFIEQTQRDLSDKFFKPKNENKN